MNTRRELWHPITWRETDLGAHTITRRETNFGAHWIRLWSPTPEQRVEELNVTSPTQERTEASHGYRSLRSRRLLKKWNTGESSTHCMQRLTTSVKLEESQSINI